MTHTINGPWKPQTSPHRDGLWETIDKRNGHLGKSFYNRDNAIAWCAEQNERALADAAPKMLAMLQRLTHPAADDDDLADALELIRRVTGGEA